MYPYTSPISPQVEPRPSMARYSPKSFAYNGRAAIALLPALAVLAAYGGSQVAAVLVVGFMGAYILDGMRLKEGSFAAVWATMGVAYLALAYNTLFLNTDLPVILALMAMGICALTLFLTGVWATLQFKWVQLQHPAVAVAFEKTLIVGCLPIAGSVQTWGIAMSGAGMESAPFFLACILCVFYYMFALPLKSSFTAATRGSTRTAVGGASAEAAPIQTRSDAVSAFILTAFLPAGVYFAIHSGNIFQWIHLWGLLLVGSGPLLFTSSVQGGTWWLGKSHAADNLRSFFVLISLAGFLAGVEGRIIFHSFGQYIRLAAPYSYIAITIAVYSVGALGLLYLSGSMGEEMVSMLVGPVIMVSSSIGGLVMGLPVWVLPAPLLASAGLALFFDSRAFRDYILFTAGAVATGGWFLWKHFWFLKDIDLDGMPLRTLCVLLIAAMLPAFLIPGLCFSGAKHTVVALPLLIQAGLMCVIEETLFAGDHSNITYNIHPMFPPFLVVATSAAGIIISRRLEAQKTITWVESYLIQCAYGSKLAMLVVPEAKLMVPVLGVALTVSPPLLLDGKLEKSSGEVSLGVSRARQRIKLLPWQGMGLAAAVVLAVVAARYALFDILHMVLNRRPSEALATGALLFTASLGCIPLVSKFYKGSAQAKRILLLTAATGLLLMLLRPPLPVSGGAECPHLPFGLCPRIWNERHAPQHEEDDVSVYGDGLRRREHWPLWLLAGAAFSGLIAATSPAPAKEAAPLRLGESVVSSALVAGYMSLEFFPGMPLIQIVIAASALIAAAAVVLIQVPFKSGNILIPFLLMLWIGCLPVVLIAKGLSSLPPLPPEAYRLMPDRAEGIEVEEERLRAILSAILSSFAAEALLLAFTLKLRVAAVSAGVLPASSTSSSPAGFLRPSSSGNFAAAGGLSVIDKAADFLGQCMPAYALQPGAAKPFMKGPASAAMQRLAQEGLAWAPTSNNIIALVCFALCLNLNAAFTDGSPWGVVLLSPILLLLSADPLFFRGLGSDSRRYFPPTAAVFVLLVGSAVWKLGDMIFGDEYFQLLSGDGLDVAKNLVLVALCVPSMVDILRFLWIRHRVSKSRALIPAIVASLGVFFGDLEVVQLLAGVAVLSGVYLAGMAESTRRAGRKLI